MTTPKSWRPTTLGDECEIVSGSTPKTNERSYWDGDIPWLTPADLSKWDGVYIDGGARYITKAGLDSCSARLFPRNTVLMSSRAPIGYTAIAAREMCTNQGFKSMLPTPTIHPEWLRYYIEYALPEIKAMSSGTTFAEISGKKLGTLPLLLPPIEEQKRIVEALDAQLSRIEKIQLSVSSALISRSNFQRSLLHSMFERLDGPNVSLGSVTQPRYGKDVAKHLRGDGFTYPVVGSAGVMTYTETALVNEPSILVGRKGNVGALQLFRTPCSPVDTAYYLTCPADVDIDFMHYQLLSVDLKSLDSSTAIPSLRRQDLESVNFKKPDLSIQKKIASEIQSRLFSVESALEHLALALQKLHALRRSVLHAAFTGQLTKEN